MSRARRWDGRVVSLVGGVLLMLLIGPGILLAAAWALGAALGKVLFYFGVVAVALTEVALVLWLVIQVVKAVRGGGWASDLPEVRSDPATDRLSGENARRNPGRTAATAAALMIGLALVTFIAVLANGLKSSTRGAIEDQVTAQYMQTAQDGFSPFAPNATTALARSPEVEVASGIRGGTGQDRGAERPDHRHRPEHDHQGLQVRLAEGLRRDRPRARRIRSDRREAVRGRREPQGRRSLHRDEREQQGDAARGQGDLQGASVPAAARGASASSRPSSTRSTSSRRTCTRSST